ncbi:hypothetical protein N7507_005023 [Penicillium longicatenatum]|nr:hypothetical protein N7507_005023 [Penicillium longicatenatum]
MGSTELRPVKEYSRLKKDDINSDLKRSLIEEYTNELPFSDRHIYYKVR